MLQVKLDLFLEIYVERETREVCCLVTSNRPGKSNELYKLLLIICADWGGS